MFRETISKSLASVIKHEPDWTKAPARVQRLLKKCLEKDPKKRLRDIGDWQDYLEEDRAPMIVAPEPKKPWAWMAACGVAVLAAAALGAMHLGETRVIPALRVSVPLPLAQNPGFMALSPDGRMLVLKAADRLINQFSYGPSARWQALCDADPSRGAGGDSSADQLDGDDR